MPPTQDELIATLVGQIKDYRQGEIPSPDTDHVTRWIKQFDEARRVPILAELTHVFQKTYFSKAKVEDFLNEVLTTKQLVGEDACAFWTATNFLNIQGGGNSQRDMLEMFDKVLSAKCNLTTQQCGSSEGPFIYLDDAVFTGNRIKRDLSDWIAGDAPQKSQVHVVTMAVHRGAQWYADNGVKKAAAAAGKSIGLTWWSALWVEDRKAYLTQSDVLRPISLPDDQGTATYVQMLKDAGYAPALRLSVFSRKGPWLLKTFPP